MGDSKLFSQHLTSGVQHGQPPAKEYYRRENRVSVPEQHLNCALHEMFLCEWLHQKESLVKS